MATIRGPRIVTNGLNWCLDAADRVSYPGSGTLFKDLGPNNKNGTLVSSPAFSSNNGGRFYFAGTVGASYINMGSNPTSNGIFSTSTMSFCIWIYLPTPQASLGTRTICVASSGVGGAMFGPKMYYDTNGNLTWSIKRAGGDIAGVGTTFSFNTFYNFVGTYDGTIRLYVNGSQIGSGTSWPGGISTSATIFTIAAADADHSYGNFYAYNVLMYNKALTATEVLQNFNAQRGRFRI